MCISSKINQYTKVTLGCCIPTPEQISLPSINILYLMASKIELSQDFKADGHYSKVKGQTRGMLLLTKA